MIARPQILRIVPLVLLLLGGAGCDGGVTPLRLECSLSSVSLDVGRVLLGGSVDTVFTITASGTKELSGTVSLSDEPECDEFTIIEGAGDYSLAPGKSRSVRVRFTPTSSGIKNCVVDVGNGACSSVSLAGRGESLAECSVDTTEIDFGIIIVGALPGLPSETFSITNTGGDTLNGVVEMPTPCEGYIVSGEGAYSLAAGDKHKVKVTFDPLWLTPGLKTCTINTGCEDVHVSAELFPAWRENTLDQCTGTPNHADLPPNAHLADVAFASPDSWWVIGYTDYRALPEDQRNYLLGSLGHGYDCGLADLDSLTEFIWAAGMALVGDAGFIVGSPGVIAKIEVDVFMCCPVMITHLFDAPKLLYDVSMLNGSNAIAVGDAGTVVVTADGGTSWDVQSAGSGDLRRVAFVASDVAVAVGRAGTVVRSTDGGTAWTPIAVAAVDFHGIDFVDTNIGTIVGDDGAIYRSTDGGQSWISQSIPTTDDLYGVCFVHPDTGVVVGGNVTDRARPQDGGPGSIWRTFDGGETWLQEEVPPTSRVLTSVKLYSARVGMAVGYMGTLLMLE